MINLVSGLLFTVLLVPNNLSNSCNDYFDNHPIRSNGMMQVVLKSYGYYEGNIDGLFGSISKNALIQFQLQNNIVADGIIGSQTCNLLLKKSEIIKKVNSNISIETSNTSKTEKDYSQEIYDAQLKLNKLPKNSSKIRIRNRCEITGRPHGVYRKLKISRIALRDMASSGKIPGMTKSSW